MTKKRNIHVTDRHNSHTHAHEMDMISIAKNTRGKVIGIVIYGFNQIKSMCF